MADIAVCDRMAIMHRGRIRALGTIDEMRQQTAAGDSSLEELFLRLTGGLREGPLDTALDG